MLRVRGNKYAFIIIYFISFYVEVFSHFTTVGTFKLSSKKPRYLEVTTL